MSLRPTHRQKYVWQRKTWKRDLTPSIPPKTCPGAQNMKTWPDSLHTAENVLDNDKDENGTRRRRYRRKWVRARKTWKREPTPTIPSKTSPGVQNMKTGTYALCTAKICLETQNMKTGPDALGTAENKSERAKLENGSLRHWYRRKRLLKHKTWKPDPTFSVSPKMSQSA
jgi:hypothetical protein